MSEEKQVRSLKTDGVCVEAGERPGSTSTPDSNEDKADFIVNEKEGYAWVFDGASSLSEPLLEEESTDGHWYVNEFNEALRREIQDSDWNREIEDMLEKAIESVRESYENLVEKRIEDISDFQTP